MSEKSIAELKKQIAELECQNKALKQVQHLDYMTMRLLVTAGHVDEDLVKQARDLAEGV